MRITKAGISDIPQLRNLWKEAFGDSDEYLDLFFSAVFPTCDTFCARENAKITAMLFALPQTLAEGECTQKAAYLYAIATKKTYRGQGICRKLVDFSVKKLLSKGVSCIYLACHTPELAAMYRKLGFSGAELAENARSLPLSSAAVISASEYAGLRETLLYDLPHIRYPKSAFSLLQNAVFYRLPIGCAVQESGSERLLERLPESLSQPPQFMVYGENQPFYAAFAFD